MRIQMKIICLVWLFGMDSCLFSPVITAQPLHHAWSAQSLQFDRPYAPELTSLRGIHWEMEGDDFTCLEKTDSGYQITQYDPADELKRTVLADSRQLSPAGSSYPLNVENYTWYPRFNLLLIFTNSKRVWRAHTRGDFWVFDRESGKLIKLGNTLPPSSLQFAKISPDGTMAAFVSGHNIYVETLSDGRIRQLTTDGTATIINGTFDWAYEEELFCRDGFRWSPDSKTIAYWQVNASGIRDFLMIDNTDSIYSFTIPVQYPKVGYNPSSVKIGVVDVASGHTRWMHIPGDPVQHYLPRMDWAHNSRELMVQQFNRRQDSTWLYLVDTRTAAARVVYEEGDPAWVDINYFWQYDRPGWDWINGGKQFLWTTEKDGWKHVYCLDRDGANERLVTKGNYDVIDLAGIDRKDGLLYFTASPENATRQYLYVTRLDGKGDATRISPQEEKGTHTYHFSPSGTYAVHIFSNHNTPPISELVRPRDGKILKSAPLYKISSARLQLMLRNPMSFFRITTSEGVTMDGWMIRPAHFDSTKKYPVLFYVYGEPAACTVKDRFSPNPWYQKLADTGYVIISMDNRGTPAPKGRQWRKAIVHNIGILNVHDQAMGAEQILKWPWVDTSRIAVWGWSGGGSSTQSLMFKYPGIYKTGMAVAGVSNLLFYDNIYEERYMGLIPKDLKYYQEGSPVNYAAGLQGNLLIIHGSGDDNVHYQNQEALINALVKAGKQFRMMEYPNRTHGISEGAGTTRHLYQLLTTYLETHCPPGAR